MNFDKKIMQQVLELAKESSLQAEVPVACVITKNNQIIASQHNLKEKSSNSLYHAELLAINEASKKLGKWRLDGCTLYVNLEPCLMCLGGIIESRISKIVFSAYDYNMGGINGRCGIGEERLSELKIDIISGIYLEESKKILQEFFKKKR